MATLLSVSILYVPDFVARMANDITVGTGMSEAGRQPISPFFYSQFSGQIQSEGFKLIT
jgi:hypothetical protein